jgi:hypothetical protein
MVLFAGKITELEENMDETLRPCPQARFWNHKIIKSYLSHPQNGMIGIGGLAGIPETMISL